MAHATSVLRGCTAAALIALATSPVAALDDARQVMVAGNSQGQGAVQWAGPGMSNVYTNDFPGAGQGELAASVRMPAGTLRNLKVNLVTQNVPTSGNFRVRLRVNGANTALSCMVTATGICNSNQQIVIGNNARIVFLVTNTFPDSGTMAWTASVEFD